MARATLQEWHFEQSRLHLRQPRRHRIRPLQVVAHSKGAATATTRVGEDYTLARTGWCVNVHLGPNLNESEYAPSVSCGDLPVP